LTSFTTGLASPAMRRSLQPAAQSGIERIGQQRHQPLPIRASTKQQTLPLQRLAIGEQIEGRRHLVHRLDAGHLHADGDGQPRDAGRIRAIMRLRERLDQATAACPHQHAGGLELRRREGDDRRVERGMAHHWMPSVNWKIGRYISTTMNPIINPISSISSGPNSRVAHSAQRAISSS
jgi:hypothetical protein